MSNTYVMNYLACVRLEWRSIRVPPQNTQAQNTQAQNTQSPKYPMSQNTQDWNNDTN